MLVLCPVHPQVLAEMQRVVVVNIYAPCDIEGKRQLWHSLVVFVLGCKSYIALFIVGSTKLGIYYLARNPCFSNCFFPSRWVGGVQKRRASKP